MYDVSEQFHSAVYDTSPVTQALFRFTDGTFFTNEDIHSSGLKMIEAVNYDDELKIGACLSSTLSATFVNLNGLLSGFAFGECAVSLGVKIGADTFVPTIANVTAIHGTTVYTGHSSAPYLRANGAATTEQPSFAVHCIAIYDGEVMCVGWDGQTWATSGFLAPISTNDFMTAKYATMAKSHLGYDFTGDIMSIYSEYGTIETYEFAPLGTFLIDTPEKRKTNLITVATAYDKMKLLDVDASGFFDSLTFPITLGGIYAALCSFAGVSTTSTVFINSTRSFSEAPIDADGITAKEILQWIAEAACSFARMNRNGDLELAWFSDVDVEITSYVSCNVAEYQVARIDKLQISSSENDIGVIIGTGTNGYQILDNPFLYGANDTEIRGYGTPIYDRLNAHDPFYPLSVTTVCDWSVQAGDIVTVIIEGVNYSLPIYCQTIAWNGAAKVLYESTGAEKRPVMEAENRRIYRQSRAYHEFVVDVNGLTSRIENAEGNISTLELTANSLTSQISTANGNISTLQQKVDSFTLSVTNGSTSSTIKLMAGSTEISSQSISFSGMVTFSNLTDGTTTISGSNIKTGTVSAERIDVNNLYVKHLSSADGTFSSLTTIDSSTGYGMQLYWSSIRFTKNSGSTWSGQIDVDATYGMRLFSSDEVNIYTTGSGKWVNVWGSLKVSTYAGESRIVVANPATASGGSECRWVDRTGDLGGWSLGRYTSSRKYKDSIEYFGDDYGIDVCRKLKPATFTYIDDAEKIINVGMIAEDVFEVCPDVVAYHDGEPDSLQYSNMVALAISAIQNLDKRLSKLEGSAA